jgi:hypothetical protein
MRAQTPPGTRRRRSNRLTAGEGLEALTQDGLQHFLWFGLPMKWLTDTDHHRRVAAALRPVRRAPATGRCAGRPTTAEVLDG